MGKARSSNFRESATMSDRRTRRALAIMPLERLDGRLAPSGFLVFTHIRPPGGVMHGFAPPKAQSYKPTGGPMDKAGQTLNIVYNEYQSYVAAGGHDTFTSSQSGRVQITGASVGVDIRAKGDIASLAAQLRAQGMTITSPPRFGIIEGTLPIAKLPDVAANASVIGIDPISGAAHNRS